MPESVKNPATEEYIRQLLERSGKIYNVKIRDDQVKEALGPVLSSAHTSLVTLVDSARADKSLHLRKSGGRFSLWASDLQFALPDDDPENLIFYRAGYRLPFTPWFNQMTELFDVYIARVHGQAVTGIKPPGGPGRIEDGFSEIRFQKEVGFNLERCLELTFQDFNIPVLGPTHS